MSHITEEKKLESTLKQQVKVDNTDMYPDTPTGDEEVVKTKKRDSLIVDEDSLYFKKIQKSSGDKNAQLAIMVREKTEKEWDISEERREPFFTQKLPVAKQDKKWWGSTENDAVTAAQKTFRNADLCTVRELNSMKTYFAEAEKRKHLSDKGKDDPADPH